VITLPDLTTLHSLERFGLDVLVDLSCLPVVDDASAPVVRLEITAQAPPLGDLRTAAARQWDIERGDAIVRVPRAVLRCLGDIAAGIAEQRSSQRDRFDRVPSSENVLVQHGVAGEPIVSRAAQQLRDAVIASAAASRRSVATLSPWPDGRRWAVAVTHDLDVVDLWPAFTALRLAELARKRQVGRMARVLGAAALTLGRNPVQRGIQQMLETERARNVVSTLFVLCGTPTLGTMRAGDLTYRPDGRGARKAIGAFRTHGCEINLHGSFETSDRPAAFAEQRARLADLSDSAVLGVRQHFLRMHPGQTMLGMTDAGFRFDSTWGFPDRNGFRLGVADVIPNWDGAGERQRALDLQEAPVIWMDRALSKYAGVEDPEAWIEEGAALARACRDVGGLWVGVWHPNLTAPLGFPGAPEAFTALLDRLLADAPHVAPLGELVEWRLARRSVRVRGVLADGTPDAYTSRTSPVELTLADPSGARRYSTRATPR